MLKIHICSILFYLPKIAFRQFLNLFYKCIRIPVLRNYQFCSSVDSCIVVQLCQNDRCIFAADKGMFFIMTCHSVDQRLSGFGYATADNDNFRVNHAGEDCQCGSQISGKFVHDLFCNTVTFFLCIKDGFCAEIIQCQFCLSSIFCHDLFTDSYDTGSGS